jgi:hypothetical protein
MAASSGPPLPPSGSSPATACSSLASSSSSRALRRSCSCSSSCFLCSSLLLLSSSSAVKAWWGAGATCLLWGLPGAALRHRLRWRLRATTRASSRQMPTAAPTTRATFCRLGHCQEERGGAQATATLGMSTTPTVPVESVALTGAPAPPCAAESAARAGASSCAKELALEEAAASLAAMACMLGSLVVPITWPRMLKSTRVPEPAGRPLAALCAAEVRAVVDSRVEPLALLLPVEPEVTACSPLPSRAAAALARLRAALAALAALTALEPGPGEGDSEGMLRALRLALRDSVVAWLLPATLTSSVGAYSTVLLLP